MAGPLQAQTKCRTRRAVTTTTSRFPAMFFCNYNLKPVIDVRPRWQWCTRSTFCKKMNPRISSKILTAILMYLPVATVAEVKVTNDHSRDQLAHQLECQKRSDIGMSPLRGFLQVVINEGESPQVRHLPTARIVSVDIHSYATYIEFENEKMKNGGGWMATVVNFPTKLMPAKEVLALLDSIAANKTGNAEGGTGQPATRYPIPVEVGG